MLRPVLQLVQCKATIKGGRGPNEPEISSKVYHLPHAQPNEHPHCTQGKPLDAVVCRLVRVTHTQLARPEILHFVHDFPDELLDSAEVRLDRLQFLLGLNARPVAGVGTNVHVEFDLAGGVTAGS